MWRWCRHWCMLLAREARKTRGSHGSRGVNAGSDVGCCRVRRVRHVDRVRERGLTRLLPLESAWGHVGAWLWCANYVTSRVRSDVPRFWRTVRARVDVYDDYFWWFWIVSLIRTQWCYRKTILSNFGQDPRLDCDGFWCTWWSASCSSPIGAGTLPEFSGS